MKSLDRLFIFLLIICLPSGIGWQAYVALREPAPAEGPTVSEPIPPAGESEELARIREETARLNRLYARTEGRIAEEVRRARAAELAADGVVSPDGVTRAEPPRHPRLKRVRARRTNRGHRAERAAPTEGGGGDAGESSAGTGVGLTPSEAEAPVSVRFTPGPAAPTNGERTIEMTGAASDPPLAVGDAPPPDGSPLAANEADPPADSGPVPSDNGEPSDEEKKKTPARVVAVWVRPDFPHPYGSQMEVRVWNSMGEAMAGVRVNLLLPAEDGTPDTYLGVTDAEGVAVFRIIWFPGRPRKARVVASTVSVETPEAPLYNAP
jgi:hypothetical protein